MRAASLPSAGPAVSPSGTPGHYGQAQPWSAWLPWRGRRFRQAATAVLLVFGCCSAAVQGPLWTHSPALAIVNVVTSLTFVLTGLTLDRQPGQRGVASPLYPHPRVTRYQRVFLLLLATWMLGGRTLKAVTSTAGWNGESPSAWWPS